MYAARRGHTDGDRDDYALEATKHVLWHPREARTAPGVEVVGDNRSTSVRRPQENVFDSSTSKHEPG